MTRVSRCVLMTMAVLALVVGATVGLLGCGSDGGSVDMVGPAEDIVLFPGGADAAKSDAIAETKNGMNIPGLDLGHNGFFYDLSVVAGYVDNHWFMTKAGVSYQVEAIAEGTSDKDVDLYLSRTSHPYSDGNWRSSTRSYPLMDGIVFRSAQDGVMFVDVRGFNGSDKGPLRIPYHIHVRKCQFGTFSQ